MFHFFIPQIKLQIKAKLNSTFYVDNNEHCFLNPSIFICKNHLLGICLYYASPKFTYPTPSLTIVIKDAGPYLYCNVVLENLIVLVFPEDKEKVSPSTISINTV